MWEEETTDNKFIGCFLNTDYTDCTDFWGRDTEESLIDGIWWGLNTNCTDLTDRVLRLKDSGDSCSKNNKDFVVTWNEHGLHGFNEKRFGGTRIVTL